MAVEKHDEAETGDVSSDEQQYTGTAVKRVEDYDILTGRADYVHDLGPENTHHMALVRSMHPHAVIEDINISAAEDHPECELVLTGEALTEEYSPMQGRLGFTEWALAPEKVRFVGEPVAAVVATDRYVAEDIVDLVDVDYETLDPVADAFEARKDEVLVHEEKGTNVADGETFEFGSVNEAFEDADHVFEEELSWGRISGVPLETGGVVSQYDEEEDSFDISCNCQLYTLTNDIIHNALGYPSDRVNLRVPKEIGGSYGTKIAQVNRYCVLTAIASHKLGLPVKFVEDRVEYLQGGDAHSCEREYQIKLAVDDDGTFRGLDVFFVDDLGAHPRYPVTQALKPLSVLTGSYEIENVGYDYKLVLTNKTGQTAFRGFGVQQHTWALETVVDKAARKLDFDPSNLRHKNLIPSDRMPYKLPSRNVYDSGDYQAALSCIEQIVDNNERCEGGLLDPEIVEQKREEGKYRGVQSAVTLEPAAGAMEWADRQETENKDELSEREFSEVNDLPEYLRAKLREDGTVEAYMATSSQGQSHRTLIAQLLADELGIHPTNVKVEYLGTVDAPTEFGSAASRMAVMLSGAAAGLGEKLRSRFERLAALSWNCDESDVKYRDGVVIRSNTGDRLTLAEIASIAGDDEAERTAEYSYRNPALDNEEYEDSLLNKMPTYPTVAVSADAPIVEVDIKTGEVEILKYYSFHDCGTILNPEVVEGQIHGAVAHGIGAALFEEFGYNDNGQPQAVTMFDYLLPSIQNVPEMELAHEETPSPFTETGAKGAGEGGVISAPATISVSINEALAPLDDRDIYVDTIPITPNRLRHSIGDD